MKRYLVLEYIPGHTITGLIQEHKDGVGSDRSLNLVAQITNALACIHAHGILHRDLNPNNVIINPTNDEVKVVDFGLSTIMPIPGIHFQVTSCGAGMPRHRSPELAMGPYHSYPTDFYSKFPSPWSNPTQLWRFQFHPAQQT